MSRSLRYHHHAPLYRRVSLKLTLLLIVGVLSAVALVVNTYPTIFDALSWDSIHVRGDRHSVRQRSNHVSAPAPVTNGTVPPRIPQEAPVDDRFLVNSKRCQIPNMNPFDASVASMITKNRPIDCSTDFPNFTFAEVSVSVPQT